MNYTPYIWPSIICTLLLTALALYLRRFQNVSSVRYFNLLILVLVTWVAIGILDISTVTMPLKTIWFVGQYGVSPLIGPTTLALVLEFLGYRHRLSRLSWLGILAIPLITVALLPFSFYDSFFLHDFKINLDGPTSSMIVSRGWWYWIYAGYSYVLIVADCAILLTGVRQRTMQIQNALLMAICIIAPMMTNVFYNLDFTPFDWSPTMLIFSTAFFAFALFRSPPFSIAPVARSIVVDALEDLVIVLDAQDRIVDFNHAAQHACGFSANMIGAGLDKLPMRWAEVLRRYSGQTNARDQIVLDGNYHAHTFDLTISPIQESSLRQAGRLFLLHDITPLKQTEQALRASERYARNIIDSSVDMIITTDPERRIVEFNPAAQKAFGYQRDEVLGKHINLLYADPQVGDRVHDIAMTQGLAGYEMMNRRKNGELFPSLLSTAALQDAHGRFLGIVGVSRDISDRLRAEQALRASEEQYRQLLENVPIAVAIYALDHPNMPILYANQVTRALWQTFADDVPLIGLPAMQFIPLDEKAMVTDVIKQLSTGKTWHSLEEHLVAPKGAEINILASSILTTYENHVACLIVFNDITELKRSQAELVAQQQTLSALQERERLARELHDGLGQTLGYLNAQAQASQTLITSGQVLAAQVNLQQMALVAQNTQADLRNHILGLRTMNAQPGTLAQTLESTLQQFTQATNIPATLSMPTNGPTTWFAPAVEEQVLRIIQEALANVRKHASAHKVEVIFSFTTTQVHVVVADDGAGFETTTASDATMPHFGLAMMRERAEQFGGRLEVRSQADQGTQVLIFVPRLMAGTVLPLPDDLSVVQSLRILLVDDHPLFLDGIRNLLAARGVTIVGTAQDGVEAQTQARALHPDVIVMDVEMPRCNGIQATKLIKAEFPEIKIVMLTMSDAEDHLFAALRNGASGYLLKNLDANEFCQLLADVMRGEIPLPPGLAARVLSAFTQHPADASVGRATDEALSPRQWEILKMVAQGKLYKEIASEFNISEKTIKYHMGQILNHLHLQTREQAIAYARRVQKL